MIDPDFRDSLMTALASSVSDFNKGAAPNDAVAKAAAAADFNVEQTRRLCETFNTARTIHHFNTHPENKAASFDLSDPNEVLSILFNDHDGAKSAQVSDMNMAGPTTAIGPGYEEYDKRERAPKLGPNFPVDQTTLPTNMPDMNAVDESLPTMDEQAYRARKMIASQNQVAEQGDNAADEADLLSGNKLAGLRDELTQEYWRNGTAKLALFLRACPQEDRDTCSALLEYMPKGVQVTKDDLLKLGHVLDTSPVDGWLAKLHEASELNKKAFEVRELASQLRADTAEFDQKFYKLATTQPGGCGEDDPFAFLCKLADSRTAVAKPSKSDDNSLRAAFGFDTAPNTVSTARTGINDVASAINRPLDTPISGFSAAMQDFVSQGATLVMGGQRYKAENKAISERLRNQQREVILHDLMLNDPYLAEADPQRIAATYQTMWQLAPEASLNKELVRGVLRQGVHTQAFSPYDAAALADLEKTIREVQGTLPPRKTIGKTSNETQDFL